MFKKASLRLAVLSVLLFAHTQGSHVTENENQDGIQAAASRDPRIRPSDWLYFNNSWSFPSLPSVTNLFNGDASKEGRGLNLRKRIETLEKTQKSIIEMLNNITRDVDTLKVACVERPVMNRPGFPTLVPSSLEETLPQEPVTNKPGIPTSLPSSPEGSSPDKPVTNKPGIPTGLPSSPEGSSSTKPVTNKPGIPTSLPSSPEGSSSDKPATNKPEISTGLPSSPEGSSSDKPATNKPEISTGLPSSPEGSSSNKPATNKPDIATGSPSSPEGTKEPGKDGLLVPPLKSMGNGTPNLPSRESSSQEIPEKIVIASTTLEDGPGENAFGSISLVGFASSHDTRHNTRMPWKKDHHLMEKAN